MTAMPAARPAPTGGGTRSAADRRRWTSRLRRARMAEIDIPYGGRDFECFGDLTKTKGGEVPARPQISHRGEGRPGHTAALPLKPLVYVSRVGPHIGRRFSGGVDGRHPTQTGVFLRRTRRRGREHLVATRLARRRGRLWQKCQNRLPRKRPRPSGSCQSGNAASSRPSGGIRPPR
jgi:hypothetical protein